MRSSGDARNALALTQAVGHQNRSGVVKPTGVILKRFESPDETRVLVKGKFEIVRLGGMTIGRATYEPGWKWSEHVGPSVGASRCQIQHVGMVLAGTATAAFDDGRVVGNEPYISLHFLGADHYAK